MGLALGGAAALAAGTLLGLYPGWSAAFGLFSLIVAWRFLRDKHLFAASVLALAALTWYGYRFSLPPSIEALPLNTPLRFMGRVVEDPLPTGEGWRMLVDIEGTAPQEPTPGWGDANGRIALTIEGTPDPSPALGDAVVFRAALRDTEGFVNPGSFWQKAYAARKGIAARAFARSDSTVLVAKPAPGQSPFNEFRTGLSRAIEASAPGQGGAAIRSLTVGDRSGLDRETKELFSRTGTVHLLSVSGLHLAIVLLLSSFFLRAVLTQSKRLTLAFPVEPLARLGALLPVAGYAFLCGFSAATSRAFAMTALLGVALALSRRVSPLAAMSTTLLLLLLFSPLAVTDPGLQLSFAAIAGLFWLPPLLRGKERAIEKPLLPPTKWEIFRRKLLTGAGATLAASIAATLATAPLAAFHFGEGGWAGVVYNYIAVPLSGFVTLPISLAGVVTYPLLPGLAALLWKTAAFSVELLLHLMRAWPQTDLPRLAAPFGTPWGVLGAYLLLGALVLRKNTQSSRRATAALGCLLLIAAPATAAVRDFFDDDGHLYVLDVGSGQALALKTPEAKWVVVDGGGIPGTSFDTGADVVWPALVELGCTKLEVVVSSHPHPDHLDGLPSLVRLGRPRQIWLPEESAPDPRYGELMKAAKEVGAEIIAIGALSEQTVGGAVLRLLQGKGKSENDRSLALEIGVGRERVLVLDDLEKEEQGRILSGMGFLREAKVMVAPHHGAANAVNEEVWEAVKPSVALVSCGDRKKLPSVALMAAAAKTGTKVLVTAEEGALHAVFGPSGVLAGRASR